MFSSHHPMPVPAGLLASPDFDDKVAAYARPFIDLRAAGVPEARFPAALREIVAAPELVARLARSDGFARQAALAEDGSTAATDALGALRRGGFDRQHEVIAPRLAELWQAPAAERPARALVLDQWVTAEERQLLADWPRRLFLEGAIGRLCRACPIEALDPPAYAGAIAALAARHAVAPDAPGAALASDPTVPAALARMLLKDLAARPVEDSGTEVRVLPPAHGLARLFGAAGGVEQSRRIVTDIGTLHLAARVGRRIEVSVELEAPDGKVSRLLSLSRRQSPKAMAQIEADLRRRLGPVA